MCGIAGAAWTHDGPPLERAVLERMTSVLRHRGPDDDGHYDSRDSKQKVEPHSAAAGSGCGAGAALGFRRLSIIDLAGGHQPLSNEDGTLWIVFNGEIYNYRELRLDLEQRGHRFATSSDTETIVHLYEELGPDCVLRLRGMFAFAIWDQRRRTMFLARDRLGKKPLVYRHEGQRLLFASELKALLEVPGVPRALDPAAVNEYLTYQYVPHPRTILQGFSKLPPAHWALYAEGRLEVQRYWRPPFEEETGAGEIAARGTDRPAASNGVREDVRRLRETLTEAVRLRMRSDVPLGAFLSGGIDSTIITGLMQQQSGRPVQTFSIGFPIPSFDERSYARQAADFLGTDHHEQVVHPEALSILPRLIWHYDEPFADSSAIPMLYLSEMTRRQVTVALSGDGGDELFAGYDRYRAVALGERFDRMPGWLRRAASARVWQRLPASTEQKSRRRRFKRLVSALAYPPERRYLKWISIFDDERLPGIYTEEFRRQLGQSDAAEFLLEAYRDCSGRDIVTRTTCADLLTYLPCDILNKVDVATMAYGLEARCPFLDHEVVELAARLPVARKYHRGAGKRILLEAFGDLIPPAIRNRRKMGFGVPLDHWFRNELRPLLHDVLLSERCLGRGIFRREALEGLVAEHVANRWDHSYRLWALLVLELWQQKFLEGVG